MKTLAIFVVLTELFIIQSSATDKTKFGYVITPPLTSNDWQCFRYAGEGSTPCSDWCTRGIIRLYENGNATNATSTIQTAHGTSTDVYIYPCFKCGDPEDQAKAACGAVSATYLSYLSRNWINVENQYAWGNNPVENMQFLMTFVKAVEDKCSSPWPHTGIYTSLEDWNAITGSSSGFAQYGLWYKSVDGQDNFDGFQPFGGWTNDTLVAKTYAVDVAMCAMYVDKVHYVCDMASTTPRACGVYS